MQHKHWHHFFLICSLVIIALSLVPGLAVLAKKSARVVTADNATTSDIKDLQEALKQLGYYRGAINGHMSIGLKQAVAKLQTASGIRPANGFLNDQTKNLIFQFLLTNSNNKNKKNNFPQMGRNDLNGQRGYYGSVNPPQITPYTPPSDNDPGNVEMRKFQQQNQSGNYWMAREKDWVAIGNPPACPDTLVFQPPIDFTLATSVLYPGQQRLTGYKPHGGFRFDNSPSNNISVKIPLDAMLVNGSRYPEAGEVQYIFTFQTPCGIMYRFDHLLTLTPKFQKIMEEIPMGTDSRTTDVNPPVTVTAGEEIATAVGFTKTKNVAFDFGVYDMRKPNAASINPDFIKAHETDAGFRLITHAICWFDLFPSQKQLLVNLPAGDQASDKKSDYCQ